MKKNADNENEEAIKTKNKNKENKSKKEKKAKKESKNEKQNKQSKDYENNEEKQKMEDNIENSENTKKEQVKFFKKMKYSIANVSNYDEMVNLGFNVALKYFFGVICLVSILLPIAVTIGTIITGDEDLSFGNYLYNFFIYYLSNIIFLVLVYVFFIFIVALCMFLVTKIIKIKEKLSTWMSITIYASTLSIIIYEIFLTLDMMGLGLPYYDLLTLIIIYIYLIIILRKKRGVQNAFYRRNKKKSKKRNKNNNPA